MITNMLVSRIKTILGYGMRGDQSSTMKDTQLVTKSNTSNSPQTNSLPTIHPVNPADWETVDRLVDENFRRWMDTEEKNSLSGNVPIDRRSLKRDLHTVDAIHSKLERLKRHVRDVERIGK